MMQNQTPRDDQYTLIATEKGLEPLIKVRARNTCEQYIQRYYPIWQQLNLMRGGSAAQQKAMGQFIDACRAWSNGESLDLQALEAIKPE